MKKNTEIVNAGRSKKWAKNVVNPPVTRASTVVFNSVAEMKHATKNRANQVMFLWPTRHNNLVCV